MEDDRAGIPLEHSFRHQRGHERAAHSVGVLVDEEHTIGVAVERQSEVGTELRHRTLHVGLILGLDGVGRVVGKGAVEFDDWWFNVRPSNTEPLLRLNVEAISERLLQEKTAEVLALIREA